MRLALEDVIEQHLGLWWRCYHEQPPMGITMTIHECRQCERELEEVAAHLVGPIRGHFAQSVKALAGPNDSGVATFREEVREGYLLAIEEALGAIGAGS